MKKIGLLLVSSLLSTEKTSLLPRLARSISTDSSNPYSSLASTRFTSRASSPLPQHLGVVSYVTQANGTKQLFIDRKPVATPQPICNTNTSVTPPAKEEITNERSFYTDSTEEADWVFGQNK